MFDRLYCDKRSGCVAIYPMSRKDDKNGCGRDDERNIAFSDEGANFNGNHWDMDENTRELFQKAVDVFNETIESLVR